MNNELRTIIIHKYLDWVNNYLTVAKYAEHNGLTLEQAVTFLELAKSVYNSKHPEG